MTEKRIVSVDIETTGLDPSRHEAWEIALVNLDPREGEAEWFVYDMPVSLVGAEPKALEVGGFHERYALEYVLEPGTTLMHTSGGVHEQISVGKAVQHMAETLEDATPLGAAVHFDMEFIEALFRKNGLDKCWHHRYLDLGSFAAGAWGAERPLSTNAMADRVPNEAAHEALADARWNVEVYKRIINDPALRGHG